MSARDAHWPNRLSSYALNVLVMAMLYDECPLGYPSTIYPVDGRGRPVRGDVFKDIEVPEETATVIKRVVWDILQTYPRAGMKPMLVIANRRLEPVIAGQPYKTELKALHAAGPCAWSIVKQGPGCFPRRAAQRGDAVHLEDWSPGPGNAVGQAKKASFGAVWTYVPRKVNWFTKAQVQEIEGGYTVEISLNGGAYFGGEGNWVKLGAKGVYGFDVAVDEGDDKEVSRQVWRGDANDAEATSHFGTLVLVAP